MASYQELPVSFKNAYPFRLATTSFIYPADWCTNARLLGAYVDEIELLFLDSSYDGCFPSPREIKRLASLSDEYAFSYNIHLPTDVFLGSPQPSSRSRAIETFCRVFSLSAKLNPTTWTLHLPFGDENTPVATIDEWRAWVREGLEKLLTRCTISPDKLSIETLHYPYAWVGDIVRDLNLRVCFDTGHLMVAGHDLLHFYKTYAHSISIIHLHGVDGYTDHVSLDRFSETQKETVLALLEHFTGTVSLEVFSENNLRSSLKWLERNWLFR